VVGINIQEEGKQYSDKKFFTYFLPLRILTAAPDLYFFGGATSAVLAGAVLCCMKHFK